jgi:hypothetical protein
MIHFLVPANQDVGVRDYLDVAGANLREDFSVLHYEDLASQNEFQRGTYVLSALDQLSIPTAQLLSRIYDQLKDSDGVRFLNQPVKTLRRFELLTELNRTGLNEFRVAYAAGNLTDLRFPVFLRHQRLHEGSMSPLLNSTKEIRQAIGQALVQGHKLKDLLVIEFCDTSNETGYYRKYAAFVVGDKVIPRSLNYGRDWMLKHAGTEFTMPMVLEELDYVTQNPHQDQLLKIFKLANVEYGRIDYAIKNDRVQTWEINLNPTIGRGLRPPSKPIAPDLDAVREKVRQCFYQRFESAWREVQLPTLNHSKIKVEIEPAMIEAASISEISQSPLLDGIRTALRPAKPLIVPLSSPFLRGLGGCARLFRRGR